MQIVKYTSTVILVLAFFSFSLPAPLPIGSELPLGNTTVKDISGKSIVLKNVKKEKGLLVMFTCNTCPYVVKNQQRTNEICAYANQRNIGVILLNSNAANRNGEDSYEAMQAYAKEQRYNWIYAVDDRNVLADAFGASRTPECYLFDQDAKLVYHGAIDNNPGDDAAVSRKHLQLAIDESVAGKAISVAETKSVGCGIKRSK